MKMKKIIALIVSAVALVASFTTFNASTVKANADNSSDHVVVELVKGYSEYNNAYVTERLEKAYGIQFESRKEYSFEYKPANINWDTQDEAEQKLIVSGQKAKSGKTTFQLANDSDETKNDVIVRFYYTEGEGDAQTKTFAKGKDDKTEFGLNLITKTSADSMRYASIKLSDYQAYQAAVEAKVADVIKKYEDGATSVGYYYPTLQDVEVVKDDPTTEDVNESKKFDFLVADNFDYSDLTKTVYYCRPGSSSFASTTSSSFNINGAGKYSFYVLAKDALGNEMKIDTEKHVRKTIGGIEGWYVKDNDNVENNEALYAPIFSFHFGVIKDITIEIEDEVVKGFEDLVYKDAKELINVVGDSAAVEYSLYYSATSLILDHNVESKVWSSQGVEIVKEHATLIDENFEGYEAYAFDQATLNFTPVERGYYYIVVRAADESGEFEAVTYAISVQNGFVPLDYETEFFKNNLFSVICLAIAFVLLIAIIVVFFFYKPKEETAEESVEPVSKK